MWEEIDDFEYKPTNDVLSHVELMSLSTLKVTNVPLENPFGPCRLVSEFQKLETIGEGSYGIVFRARDKQSNEIVALKKLKNDQMYKEGFPVSGLREIGVLKKCNHENIVALKDIVVGKGFENIYLVLEYCHQDVASLIDDMCKEFTEAQTKCILMQTLTGLDHLHSQFILHRDLTMSNLLITEAGIVKISDFGLTRILGMPPKSATPNIITLWYRAPEVLFQSQHQSTAVDMWAAGCVFGELLANKPLFPGNSDIDQINLLVKLLGTPTESSWPGLSSLPVPASYSLRRQPENKLEEKFPRISKAGLFLLSHMLTYDPKKRATAKESLKSPYFKELPLPCPPSMLIPKKETSVSEEDSGEEFKIPGF